MGDNRAISVYEPWLRLIEGLWCSSFVARLLNAHFSLLLPLLPPDMASSWDALGNLECLLTQVDPHGGDGGDGGPKWVKLGIPDFCQVLTVLV